MNLETIKPHQTTIPPIHFQHLPLVNGQKIFIAREDLLPGGTKQRACQPYLQHLVNSGYSQFIYASPFAGFAQVALSYCAQRLGIQVILFCEKDPATQNFHEFSLLAQKYGAQLILCDSLIEAETQANHFLHHRPSFFKIPLGFDDITFRQELKNALTYPLQSFFEKNPKSTRLWVSLGSGTLLKCLRQILPRKINIEAVNVHVLRTDDPRIEMTKYIHGVTVHSATQKFSERCEQEPPIPSNIHYDAKVWSFLKRHAQDGDLWWNVAR